jgi:hypothetical protein
MNRLLVPGRAQHESPPASPYRGAGVFLVMQIL